MVDVRLELLEPWLLAFAPKRQYPEEEGNMWSEAEPQLPQGSGAESQEV